MSSTLEGITVSCAIEGCHWKGSPADAPGHECPTPAETPAPAADPLGEPFAGMRGADGLPLAETLQDDLPFAVVWTSANGQQIVRVGTRGTEEDALELADQVEIAGDEQVHVQRIGEPAAADVAAAEESPAMSADFEPGTDAEIAAWLARFGQYDDQGVPQDEKTARLDAKIGETLGETPTAENDEEPTPIAVPEPEPELEEPDEPLAAEHDLETLWPDGQEPWQVSIAKALEFQPEVAAYRWLVVDTAAKEIVGRAKVKREIEELLENVRAASEAAEPPALEIAKTQAVIEAAEELQIEKRREMVPPDEPARTPASEPSPKVEKPEADEEPEQPKEPAGLFDATDYDREDLQIPRIDGNSIDKIRLDFAGSVMLDRSNPDHVALFNTVHLGQDVRLTIDGKGSMTGAGFTTNKEGDLDSVVGRKTVKVEQIQILGSLVESTE